MSTYTPKGCSNPKMRAPTILSADALHPVGPSPVGVRARLRGDRDHVALLVTFHTHDVGMYAANEHYVTEEHLRRLASINGDSPAKAGRALESGIFLVEDTWGAAKERAEQWVGSDAQWRDVTGKRSSPYFVPDEDEVEVEVMEETS